MDAADEQGTTALHQAARSSPCAVVEALLAHQAAINQQDKVLLIVTNSKCTTNYVFPVHDQLGAVT